MSHASKSMQQVARGKWPFGYIWVDSTRPRPIGTFTHVDRCEIHFRFSDDRPVTLFCHVVGINRKAKEYGLFLFSNESATKLLAFIDVSYVEASSTGLETDIYRTEQSPFTDRLSALMRIVHPIIFKNVIRGIPPKDEHGRTSNLWYNGFVEDTIEELEECSKLSVRSFIVRLAAQLPK